MLAYLKIKIVSLAAEASLIRKSERKIKWKRVKDSDGNVSYVKRQRTPMQDKIFFGLKNHRTEDVRTEARAAQLAYGYLRGKLYRELEADPETDPDWIRVKEIVKRFGSRTNMSVSPEAVDAWGGTSPVVLTAVKKPDTTAFAAMSSVASQIVKKLQAIG